MKNIRNYIIVSALAFIVVASCFFMPELTDLFDGRKEKTYSFETNKTSFSVSDNVPFALRFTEVLPVAEKYSGSTDLSAHDARMSAENFFYSMKPWRYGCVLEFMNAEPFNCKSDEYGFCIVWKVYFYSETLQSTLMFAVNDSSNTVIGFFTHYDGGGKNMPLLINDYYYYINKFLPDMVRYYGWVSAYSHMETILSGNITYKIAFVDEDGDSASVMMYYDYRSGNVIFNMANDSFESYRVNESYTEQY